MESLLIKEVTRYLESLAPKSLQEGYDNCGLLTGIPGDRVTGILVTLDCTEGVIEEAIRLKCNLIVAHHPIIFKGLKKLTGENYVERTVIKAIKNDIALYAIHTNLDHVLIGVNKKIAEKLGLRNVRILSPKKNTLNKLVTFAPLDKTKEILERLYQAGAGQIGNYKNCSFSVVGKGTFLPNEYSKPHRGQPGKQEEAEENRIEVIFPEHLTSLIVEELKKAHPYEEVAYYISRLENENQEVGAGMIGDLPEAQEPKVFLERLKRVMKAECVRYTSFSERLIKKVAICGGSGSFLLPGAIQAGADAFVSADFKYHEFFDADGQILVADIGHFESEQYTKELLKEVLEEKFPTFAINFSNTITNPISYL
jgi:dinuclear metal center YbgI/SA1388 family protein